MEKELAARLLKASLALDLALGSLDEIVSEIPDQSERRLFARGLGDVMGLINECLIRPIARQHPSLDPD